MMFGRFGWAEILVIVVLVVILFGSNKIPGMMKNLADGLNVFKKEIKNHRMVVFLSLFLIVLIFFLADFIYLI